MQNTAILLVQCPDRKGLDATIAEFIYRYDGNILHFEQHQAGEECCYLARVEWELGGFRLALHDFDGAFGPIAHKFGMNWVIVLSNRRPSSFPSTITAWWICFIASAMENSLAISP